MKILLRNGLVYCSTLVLTGHACIETVPQKLQRENKLSDINSTMRDNNKAFQQYKVPDQAITGTEEESELLKDIIHTIHTIHTTQQQINGITSNLYQYKVPDQATTSTEKESELLLKDIINTINTTQQQIDGITSDWYQYCVATQKRPYKEQIEIPNIRPTARREAIQPVKLVHKDLQMWATHVHKYIPKLAELKLIPTLIGIQNTINILVLSRRCHNDLLLTDEQKIKLGGLKYKLKVDIERGDSPCFEIVNLYKIIYDKLALDGRLIESRLTKFQKQECLKRAEKINKYLQKTIKEINDLVDLLKV